MANYEKFTEQEIPYGILEKFGLAQEMIDDLPLSVRQRLLSSRWTPVLPIVTEDEYGERHKAYARISLVRKTDGTVDVVFAPYCGFDNMGNYSEEDQEKLRQGSVIIADVDDKNGVRTKCYVQYDKTTNQNMYVPVLLIQQNISILADRMGLDYTDRETLQDCEILEIPDKEETASIGVDLFDRSGLRVADGDRNQWLNEAYLSEILPKYNFGINGCWVTDENGSLSYVSDNNFTEEMERELNRQGLHRAAGEQLKR